MAGLFQWDQTYFLDAIHDVGFLTGTCMLYIVVFVRGYGVVAVR